MIDLNKAQGLLEEKKTVIIQRLEAIMKDKTKVDGPLDPDFEEQAGMLENHEVVDHLDELERKELEEINNALLRIKNNTYGKCIECGEDIQDKRLNAVPTTTICMNCIE